MIVLEALAFGEQTLRSAWQHERDAPTSPMLDVELLFAFAHQVPRTWLFSHLNTVVDAKTWELFEALVKRRSAREPVAYLLGKKAFYGRDFLVTPDVLIPRPDTETLIEEALRITQETSTDFFVDIGTGSGAIGVTLAAETGLPGLLTDISRGALVVAEKNAAQLGISHLVTFQEGRGLEPLLAWVRDLRARGDSPPDELLITANLPYLTEEQWEETSPDIRLFEPKGALLAGEEGLQDYRELLQGLRVCRRLLPTNIHVLFEIDPGQVEGMRSLFARFTHAKDLRFLKDLGGDTRVVSANLSS